MKDQGEERTQVCVCQRSRVVSFGSVDFPAIFATTTENAGHTCMHTCTRNERELPVETRDRPDRNFTLIVRFQGQIGAPIAFNSGRAEL